MNLKRPTTMFSLVLLSVTVLSGFAIQDFAYAQESGMSLSANAAEGATTISISGHTSVGNNDITIVITAPNGNVVSVDQVSPDANGDFMTEIQVGGQLWKQDGTYKITAQQGTSSLHKLSVQVQVVEGTTLATSVSDSTLESLFTGVGAVSEDRGLTIVADVVPGATTIPLSGHTDRTNIDITIVVTAPNGNIVSVDQVSPDANGDFMTEIQTKSQLWKQDGMYTITAQQGEASGYRDSVQVEIIDGAVIPEFGTIAALILAVAIISIIAVTAKTRLSIIPRY